MTISKQFKLLNLKKRRRKLCTDKVGGVKMKKNTFYNLKKRIFSLLHFLAAPLVSHFKDDLYTLRRHSSSILNHSNWRRIGKDLPKWLVVIGQRSVMGRSSLVIYIFCYPIQTTETGTTNRWGTTNSKPPGRIIMHLSEITSYLLHSSQQCTTLLCHLPTAANCFIMLSQSLHILTFLHPILLCRITYWAPLEML